MCCVYRPPGGAVDISMAQAKLLSDCICCICNVACSVSIVGDFNLPGINWDNSLCPQDGIHDVLFDNFVGNSLLQYVNSPTRNDNILDLVFCSDENSIFDVSVTQPFANSDHMSVTYKLLLETKVDMMRTVSDWKNADYEGIAHFLSTVHWDEYFEKCAPAGQDRVNDYNVVFESVMEACIHEYVPKRKLRKGFARKLPRRLRRMRARTKLLYKNRKNDLNGRRLYKESSVEFDRAIKEYCEKLEEKCVNRGDVKHFYDFANSKLNSKTGVGPLKNSNGEIILNDQLKCEILNKYFASVFTVDDGNRPIFDYVKSDKPRKDCENVVFTARRICKLLRTLPNKTSRTPDGVPALFLKNIAKFACSEHGFHDSFCICTALSRIFTVSFNEGYLPSIWLTANVVPLYKKGDASEACNYRPISLTCILCKVMETLVKEEMMRYLLSHNLITKQQHGFLSKKSVTTQMLECANDWTKCQMNKKCSDTIYLDFAKAFDTVSHPKLLQKLQAYGINGLLLSWIGAFLNGRTQRVFLGECCSDTVQVTSSVPQGSVLGPLLFLLYINDVCNVVENEVNISGSIQEVNVKLFADDIKIYADVPVHNHNGQNVLNDILYRVTDWANTWQLKLSVKKCAVMCMGKNNPKFDYTINGISLDNVSTFRDLGIMVSSDLKQSVHCRTISAKAMRVTGLIFRAFGTKKFETLLRAYVTYVRPIVESCTPVWSPHLKKDILCIERVQRYFTRRLYSRCGLLASSYQNRCKYLGLQSLELRRLRFDTTMCFKILSGFVNVDSAQFFRPNLRSIRGHNRKLLVESCRIDCRKYFFNNRVIRIWNSLSQGLVNSSTVDKFRAMLCNDMLTKFCREFAF